jgi:hypothetical protein
MKQSFHFLLLATLSLFGTVALSAQTQVQGRIVDNQGEPLALANILLLTAADSAIVRGEINTISDEWSGSASAPEPSP